MTSPQSNGSSGNWANIIAGSAEGASKAMQGNSQYANSKREALEQKRRTIANLLSQAMKRNRGLYQHGQEHQNDMSDFQSQALQQMAAGFTKSLEGYNQ
jgi:pantothenate synthetase